MNVLGGGGASAENVPDIFLENEASPYEKRHKTLPKTLKPSLLSKIARWHFFPKKHSRPIQVTQYCSPCHTKNFGGLLAGLPLSGYSCVASTTAVLLGQSVPGNSSN